MDVGAGLYMYDVVVKSSSSLSHLLMCSCFCMYGYGFLSGGKRQRRETAQLVRLLSAMSISHFGELWLARSHGGGITSGM